MAGAGSKGVFKRELAHPSSKARETESKLTRI